MRTRALDPAMCTGYNCIMGLSVPTLLHRSQGFVSRSVGPFQSVQGRELVQALQTAETYRGKRSSGGLHRLECFLLCTIP